MDSIKPEAGELLTQLAFYADWPNVFSAMAVFREVFAQRPSAVAARSALAQPDVFELALFFVGGQAAAAHAKGHALVEEYGQTPACLMVSMMRPSAREECRRLG